MFGGNFAPAGWAFCEGQLLAIAENDTLFNLLGTTYGGDGQETFALPDLRGRIPIHQGNGFILAQSGGAEEITLTIQQIASHTHAMVASQNTGTGANPGGNVLDQMSGAILVYKDQPPTLAMSPRAVGPVGGSQPHTNFQPYLCVDFIISLFGIFPSQT
ncbi:MAG TPA: tail fiber protein [Chthoniobacterales bacterium]